MLGAEVIRRRQGDYFENDAIGVDEATELVGMGSTHGDRTKAIARKHVVQACAERVVRIVTANVELVPEPALEPGQGPESDETSSVTVLADVNTATREYIAGLQEENRQLREGGSPSARKYRSQSKG